MTSLGLRNKNNLAELVHSKSDRKTQNVFLCYIFPVTVLISTAFIAGTTCVVADFRKLTNITMPGILGWEFPKAVPKPSTRSKSCEIQCRPDGAEALPKGIVSRTSNFQMQPLWGPKIKRNSKTPMSLLAVSAGLKQKENVDKLVKKFLRSEFVVMLFHYDGKVDDWKDLEWSSHAVHISAMNQTKWWFAKRFLHPDIVSEYEYIFLWDEDLGVDNFDPGRYVSTVKEEGLEISQPALDPQRSYIHYPFLARDSSYRVHRKINETIGPPDKKCYANNTNPPCRGFVEMMAPVFSRASWRCTWHMIQNDLVIAWGLDYRLGYCALGDRNKNVGVVDSDYIVHYSIPTLGGQPANEKESKKEFNIREQVLKRSLMELEEFQSRWNEAAGNDKCWVDPYQN